MKFTEVSKFYLVNHREEDPKALAKKLNVSIAVVYRQLKKLDEADNKNKLAKSGKINSELPKEEKPNKIGTARKLFGKNERGSTVMTEAASSVADATRKNRIKSKKLSSCIHKPFPDESN